MVNKHWNRLNNALPRRLIHWAEIAQMSDTLSSWCLWSGLSSDTCTQINSDRCGLDRVTMNALFRLHLSRLVLTVLIRFVRALQCAFTSKLGADRQIVCILCGAFGLQTTLFWDKKDTRGRPTWLKYWCIWKQFRNSQSARSQSLGNRQNKMSNRSYAHKWLASVVPHKSPGGRASFRFPNHA